MSITQTQIQQAYIAFFGRPAEPMGLTWWTAYTGSVNDMYAEFSASAEYRSYYAPYINAGTGAIVDPAGLLNEVYNNLFNRDIEHGGLAYWSPLLASHAVTIDNVVLVVLGGAQNADAVAIADKVIAANAFTAEAASVDYSGYAGAEAAADAHAWLGGIYDAPTLAAHLATLHADVVETIEPARFDGHSFILTPGIDTPVGTSGDDIFRATQLTLNGGDIINGGAGQDTLTLDITGTGHYFDYFETNSVETIEVKSLSSTASIIDLSDVNGLATLVSNETNNAPLTFEDIQSVNDVNISIIDTKETHNFTYDLNAYTAGTDIAELRLQEIRNAVINFGTFEGTPGKSLVDQLNIDSETIVDPALGGNVVADLNVGDNLSTILIKGNANLQVVAPLDPFLVTVDAHLLNANLSLDLSAESATITRVTYTGAQGNNFVTFGVAGNEKAITTFAGNDTIIAGEGNNTIGSGAGNDIITSGAGNDIITSGAGDDSVTSGAGNDRIYGEDGNDTINAGAGNNLVDGGAGNDSISTGLGLDTVYGGSGADYLNDLGGSNVIDMGSENDVVQIGTLRQGGGVVNGMGHNSIDLGTGDDTLWMDAKELEVGDTITGNTGYDTIVLSNSTGRSDYGFVDWTETQRTNSIEKFDLRDAEITLHLTDHLIESALNYALTVTTENASGTQTLDLTEITTPEYHITLNGGVNQDIVIATGSTINSMSTLRFDDPNASINSACDTLIIEGSANLTATDALNVSGLDVIELRGASDSVSRCFWTIDLTDLLIDQATGNTLTIKVSPDVQHGSELHLVTDSATVGDILTDNLVQVLRNSNVTVYLNDVVIFANGTAQNFAGGGSLTIQTPLEFTENADNLVGTDGNDTFYAASPDQIDLSDFADGLGEGARQGIDTLVLGAGVYSGGSIWAQLNFGHLDNIEVLTMSEDVSFGVSFADAYEANLYEITTYNLTPGVDTVTNALSNHAFNLLGSNDVLTMANDATGVTVNGGLGNDVVYMGANNQDTAPSSVWISEVESVYGYNGNDTVTIMESNTVPVYINLGNNDDSVVGSSNADVITFEGGAGNDILDANAGNDSITAYFVETINGGTGDDTINALLAITINGGTGNDIITASGNSANDVVHGDAGNDTITVTNFEQVFGEAGTDDITISAASTGPVTITGGADNDSIHLSGVTANGNAGIVETVVFGSESAHPGAGDVITVNSGYDTIDNFAAGAHSGAQDVLDFTSLLGNDNIGTGIDLQFGNFATTGISFIGGSADNIGVVWNAPNILDVSGNSFFSTTAQGGTIAMTDNSEAVILFTGDTDGDNVHSVTVAYVCDTDAGIGQNWVVTLIGTVTFDNLTGLNAGTLGAGNFVA